jgi:hypothetical protein
LPSFSASFQSSLVGGVEGDEDLLAPLVAGLVHGFFDDLQGVLVVLEVGCEAALVAHGGGQPRPLRTPFRPW